MSLALGSAQRSWYVVGIALTMSACFELEPPLAEPEAPGQDGHALGAPGLRLPARASWTARLVGDPGELPAKHASCELAPPAHLPLSPGEIVPPKEPLQGAGCEPDLPAAKACDESTPCSDLTDVCVHPELGSAGVCVADGWWPEFAVTLSYAGGACVKVVNDDERQRLCCAHVPGVDCRARTLGDGQSAPGELCRLHGDCQAGLQCTSPEDVRWLRGWGRCLCPGVAAELVGNHPDCESPADRLPWGSEPGPLVQPCMPGESDGWVVERVASGLASEAFGVAVDAQSKLHLALENPDLTYYRLEAGAAASEPVATSPGPEPAAQIALIADDAGAVHVLAAPGKESEASPLYAQRANGSWNSRSLGTPVRALSLFWAADHTPHLGAALPGSGNIVDLSLADEALPAALIAEDVSAVELAHAGVGDQESFLYGDFVDLRRVNVRSAQVSDLDSFTSGLVAVTAHSGDLLAAYEAGSDDTLHLLRMHGADAPEREEVWTSDFVHYLPEASLPSLAVDSQDRVSLAHRAPEGVMLRTSSETGWQVIPVAKQAARPRLVIDGNDEAHVFYVVAGELRHAHRGACPTGSKP
jgi:hypothetical protein